MTDAHANAVAYLGTAGAGPTPDAAPATVDRSVAGSVLGCVVGSVVGTVVGTAARTFSDRRRAQLLAEPDTAASPVLPSLAVESCTGGALSPDGRWLAFISDRDGLPALWLTPLEVHEQPFRLDIGGAGANHARQVSWSPDGRRLTCQLAPFGGEQTRVVALRPDGSDQRDLAGGPGRAGMPGAWRPDGGLVGVSEASRDGGGSATAYAVDPATGQRTELAHGPAAAVCALHRDGRHAVVRVGRRGARQLLWVDLASGAGTPLLAAQDATVADARFAPDGGRLYLHTDSGLDRAALLALPLDGGELVPGVTPEPVAARPDADLDLFALHGERIALVWNAQHAPGTSELELLDLAQGSTRALPAPAEVVASCAFSPDGSWLLLGAEGPTQPPYLARCQLDAVVEREAPDDVPLDTHAAAERLEARRLVPAGPHGWPSWELVRPVPLRFAAHDGLELTGWWYAPHSAPTGPSPLPTPVPTVLWLHGGPEAQERPTFAPLPQALAAAGVAVFAPNVRGSSGYGRDFVNADNHDRRFAAIRDVAEAARFLIAAGLADPARLGVAGRSYGGYLTLSALVHFPELFRVGVDVCGMADLETFFAYTEPWIATAATTKYGDPGRDRELLRELSPIHRMDRLVAPLLVVHGEHDTNVPLVETEQVVRALRDRGAPHELLLFPDEGHEIHDTANRAAFVRAVVDWLTGHLLEVDEQTA